MRSDLPPGQIYRGIAPFLIAEIRRLGLLVSVPALTLWLRRQLGGSNGITGFLHTGLVASTDSANGFQRPESLPIGRVRKDPKFSVFNVAFGLIGVGLIQPCTHQSLHSSAHNLEGLCGEKSTVLKALPVTCFNAFGFRHGPALSSSNTHRGGSKRPERRQEVSSTSLWK